MRTIPVSYLTCEKQPCSAIKLCDFFSQYELVIFSSLGRAFNLDLLFSETNKNRVCVCVRVRVRVSVGVCVCVWWIGVD